MTKYLLALLVVLALVGCDAAIDPRRDGVDVFCALPTGPIAFSNARVEHNGDTTLTIEDSEGHQLTASSFACFYSRSIK